MERRSSDGLLNLPRFSTSEIEFSSDSSFVETYEKDYGQRKSQELRARNYSLWPLLVVSFLLISLGLFLTAILRAPSDMECTIRLSPYSPLFEAVEYEEVNWTNDFDQPSIYRGYPNPEREKAWENLWRHGTVNVPEEKLKSLNYSRDVDYMRTPANYGGGIEAAVEVFHQMHCLNMIRQYTYLSSYPSPPAGFNIPPSILRTHIDHCIETLRQALMCTADITPMPIKADPNTPAGASAEFSTHHKCRRWSRLTAWMEENEVGGGE